MAVTVGALVVLWGSYLFRYAETRKGQELFNRPLADKISDVHTPMYHAVLATMDRAHVVPRAYLWGFADTVHAGMEGRPYPQLIFGRVYLRQGPKYFFPAMIALKLPIGLSILALLGIGLFFARRLPADWNLSASIILACGILFLAVLARATYAGIRHALPVLVLLSSFAGFFAERAIASHSRSLQVIAAIAFALAIVSALPVMRPWEYFNELIGGAQNGYKYFSDEGVDLAQRTKELAAYYDRVLKPVSERPYNFYFAPEEDLKARDVEYLGRDKKRDLKVTIQPEKSGTFFVGRITLIPSPFWDRPALRAATPVARFGNLFVYQGTFSFPADVGALLF